MALLKKLAENEPYFKKLLENTDLEFKNDEQVYFYIWSRPDFEDALLPIPETFSNSKCVNVLVDWCQDHDNDPQDETLLESKLRPFMYTSNNFQDLFKFNINRGAAFKKENIEKVKDLLDLETPKILCYFLDYIKSLNVYEQYALAVVYHKFIEDAFYDNNIFLKFVATGPNPPKSSESIKIRWRTWTTVEPEIDIPASPINEKPTAFVRTRDPEKVPNNIVPKPPIRTHTQIPRTGVKKDKVQIGFSINSKSASLNKSHHAPIKAHQNLLPVRNQKVSEHPRNVEPGRNQKVSEQPRNTEPVKKISGYSHLANQVSNNIKELRRHNRAILKDRLSGNNDGIKQIKPIPISAVNNSQRDVTRKLTRQAQQQHVYTAKNDPLTPATIKTQAVISRNRLVSNCKIRSTPNQVVENINSSINMYDTNNDFVIVMPQPPPEDFINHKHRIHIREKIKELQTKLEYEKKVNDIYKQLRDFTLTKLIIMQQQLEDLQNSQYKQDGVNNLRNTLKKLHETINKVHN